MKSAIVGLTFSLGGSHDALGPCIYWQLNQRTGCAGFSDISLLSTSADERAGSTSGTKPTGGHTTRSESRKGSDLNIASFIMEPSAADAYLKGVSGADDITSTQYSPVHRLLPLHLRGGPKMDCLSTKVSW